MDFGISLYQLGKALILPPASLLIVAALGVILMRRWPRGARWIVGLSTFALFVLSTPLVASFLQLAAGTDQPVDAAALKSAQAIVVIGGGLRIDAAEYGGDTVGRLSLERARYAARLARSTGLPVMVTGGKPAYAKRTEADAMREVLEQEFGIPVRWMEVKALDTRGNARNCAAVLLPLNIKRIALVMHGFDVQRAVAEFRDAGFEVIAAPTLLPRPRLEAVGDLLPNAGALLASYYAVYELAGFLVRDMR